MIRVKQNIVEVPPSWFISAWIKMILILTLIRTMFSYLSEGIDLSEIIRVIFSSIETSTFLLIGFLAVKAYLEALWKEIKRERAVYVYPHLLFITFMILIALFYLIFGDLENIAEVVKIGEDLILLTIAFAILSGSSYMIVYLLWKGVSKE
ncbi:hypothetical protein [Rhodothermus profundi]|uniref:Uncharacterized protein n=1 Tax=Rhodothermus profundi TaxID=633813 RepID=A0A1M6R584_9BACT|nr:hypothetical protein [Rhodothermus profundi]SHK27645.1 hypothetical protein SAMN04488087_0712 [Rhodothermus profundi]